MASVRGLKLLLKKGNGGDPETFTAYCSVTAKTVSFDGAENTSEEIDCTDIDAIPWLVSEMVSKRVNITGNGTLAGSDFPDFFDWWDSGETSNCQVVLDIAAADGGSIIEGGFKLTKFELTGNRGDKCQVSITLGSDGAVTRVDNT